MLTIRELRDSDVEQIRRWLNVPHVEKWYHNPADWINEIEKRGSEYNWIHHFIVETDDVPRGFCQYYSCADSGEDMGGYGGHSGTYSIDYFIGERTYLRRGLGKKTVGLLIDRILMHDDAGCIAVQPEIGNNASRNLLLSCGFKYDSDRDVYVMRLCGRTKPLGEMTNEELWRLFPIKLYKYNPEWHLWFKQEKAYLESVLPVGAFVRLEHIGSTSLCSIYSKGIVDILLEASDEESFAKITDALVISGYRLMSRSENRTSFNKGYTEQGFADRVFHLHLRLRGDNPELYFRDYLLEHPSIAEEYERLKLELQKTYEFDRDAYTAAKTDFVTEYTEKSKQLYGMRYR